MKKIISLLYILIVSNAVSNEFVLIKPVSVEKKHVSSVLIPASNQKDVGTTAQTAQEENEELRQESSSFNFVDEIIDDNPFGKEIEILDVTFKEKSDVLKESSLEAIEIFADILHLHRAYQVVFYAHTDSVGDEYDNLILSKKRAQRITKELIALGISSTRLTAIGVGEKDPLDESETEEAKEKNRRIEALVIE